LIFSGDVFHNDSLTEETGGTPISSLTANTKTGISSMIKLGRVRDINGLFFGIPNVNDVLEIFTFAKLQMLSESAGDQLLHLLKDIIRRHSESIDRYFIYDRIENLNGAVTKAISQIYQGMDINITLPTRLCGTDQQEMDNIKRILDFRNTNPSDFIIAKGNGLNMVQLIAEFLLTIDKSQLDMEPITLLDNNNQIAYSRFATGDLFLHICEEVKLKYGHDVIPICVQLSFDATDITGGGGSTPRSSTPFHFRILNIAEEIFGLQSSTILAGFAPTFTVKYTNFYIFYLL